MVVLQTYRTLLVLLALVCVTKTTLGFNTATKLPSATATQSILTPRASDLKIRRVTSSSKCFIQLQAHRDAFTNQVSNLSHHINNLRSSGLFPRRHHEKAQRLTYSMTKTSEDKNISSDNKNLLIRVWLRLRALVAKLWVSSSHHNLTSCVYYYFIMTKQ